MTLEQRIDNILGPWPTPDQTREGILLLARHLQRHDELVTLQRDIDAYAADRRMPDDALDALEAHRDRLRQEIWDGTPILHLAKEAEADTGLPPLEFKPMATYGWGPDAAVKQMADTVQRWTVELSQRIAKDADGKMAAALREYGFVPKAELDTANERIEELQEGASKADVGPLDLEAIESKAHRLMVATWECDKLSYTDQWQLTSRDVPALVAEVRRLHAERDKAQAEVAEHRRHVATVMGREEALKKEIAELEARLAERDADSEVGRAIRGWKPKAGHIRAWIEQIRMIADGTPRYRMMWRKAPGREGHTCWYCSIADAIREYNERED